MGKQAQADQEKDQTGTRFSKTRLLESDGILINRDVAEAVLEAGKTYTTREAVDQINQFLKGRVK